MKRNHFQLKSKINSFFDVLNNIQNYLISILQSAPKKTKKLSRLSSIVTQVSREIISVANLYFSKSTVSIPSSSMLSPSSSHLQSQDQKVKVDVATMMEISSESSSSRRRIRSGRVDGGVQSSNLCKWTSKFATILFLLNLIALGQSLPLDRDMENRVRLGHHHRDRELASSKLSEEPQQPRQYQLVQQGQIYLPSLLQNEQQQESLDSGSDSNYPINSQNDDDSIGREWETVIDPHVYILNEWASSKPSSAIQQRKRRNAGPSLSIVNPLDVLRQRLLLEIARRRMIKSQNQIIANAEILKSIGRRR